MAPRAPEACAPLCPMLVQEALSVVGTKWAPSILLALSSSSEPLGFAELKRRLEGVTAKELSRHLKTLTGATLVAREVHPTVPPRVDYRLTDLGRHFLTSIEALADWGARLKAIASHQTQGAADLPR